MCAPLVRLRHNGYGRTARVDRGERKKFPGRRCPPVTTGLNVPNRSCRYPRSAGTFRVAAIVRGLAGALAPGSFMALNDGTGQVDPQGRQEALRIAVEQGSDPYVARTPGRIAGFFAGLELLDPGVVSTSRWRPEASPFGTPGEVDATCGLARKP